MNIKTITVFSNEKVNRIHWGLVVRNLYNQLDLVIWTVV